MSDLTLQPISYSPAELRPKAAALDLWLENVSQLLAPLHPISLSLIQSTETRARIEWLEDVVPEKDVVRAYPSQNTGPCVGWLINLGSRDGATLGLLICTSPAIPPGSTELKLAVSICRASFQLLWSDHEKSRDEAEDECLHELRNAINCVAMSAALLAGPKLPVELRGFADDMKEGVARSIKALSDVTDHLID